jgi:hypothetical protein
MSEPDGMMGVTTVWPAMTDGDPMVAARLPEEGELRLGSVRLPAGRLINGWHGRDHHVAWATVEPVPESGRVWAALSELHPQTGLVPIRLDGLRGDTMAPRFRVGIGPDGLRPWDNGEFGKPEDPGEADSLEVGALLHDMWNRWVPPPDEDDPEWIEMRAPFTREWPGLAAPQRTPLTPAERQQALDSVRLRIRQAHGAARIGLVAADRPADVLPVIGWGGLLNRGESLLPLTALLRSWEDRFGARLIQVGYDDLQLLVERPPRTLEAAQRIAAEHVVLADECIDAHRDIPHIAASLVNTPIWTFWWD